MTLSDIINTDIECGCDIDDLAPCDSPDLDECRVAKSRVLGPDEGYVCEAAGILLGPGDTLYEPIEVSE